MSKRKTRQRKREGAVLAPRLKLKTVAVIALLLCLSLAGGIFAQWRATRIAARMNPMLAPAPVSGSQSSPSKEYIYAGGRPVATEEPVTSPTPSAIPTNVALGKTATESSTAAAGPGAAVDGNTDGNFYSGTVTHTNPTAQPWWQVDLGASYSIQTIKVWNRTDCCGERLSNFYVFVSDDPLTSPGLTATQNQSGVSSYYTQGQAGSPTTLNINRTGRYVRVQLAGTDVLSLAEVQVMGTPAPPAPSNVALGKTATESSTAAAGPGAAVDGNTDGNFYSGTVTHTNYEAQPWWQVDLGASYSIQSVKVWNRTDCCGERLSNFNIMVSDTPINSTSLTTLTQNGGSSYYTAGQAGAPTAITINRTGRYVRVQLAGTDVLSLAEVQVIGTPTPPAPTNLALNKTATQVSELAGGAGLAVDGNTNGNWYSGTVTHTDQSAQAWWQVDLGSSRSIQTIKVWNRTDCCGERLSNFNVMVSDTPINSTSLTTLTQNGGSSYYTAGQGGSPTTLNINRTGRYVRVQLTGTDYLSLAEVEVLGN